MCARRTNIIAICDDRLISEQSRGNINDEEEKKTLYATKTGLSFIKLELLTVKSYLHWWIFHHQNIGYQIVCFLYNLFSSKNKSFNVIVTLQ